MSIWDTYPSSYRHEEVQAILKAVHAGECVSIIGLSGAGKSNLMGFLAHRINQGTKFFLVDCNNLPSQDSSSLFNALIEALGGMPIPQPSFQLIVTVAKRCLDEYPSGICILIDRFDLFNQPTPEMNVVAGNLRSLRDHFKYNLTYGITTRTPLDPSSELAELFYGNTIWLGSLNHEDSLWSINQYASRKGMNWDGDTVEQILELSQGYPSVLRAICEAHAGGVPLELNSLRNSITVRRCVEEFWSDSPDQDTLHELHLESHPIFQLNESVQLDMADLTTAEQRMLKYFEAHPDVICEKDDLIQAIWSEEKLISGLRDDSLAQLVHRLRMKIDTPERKHIQTITGRGYRYRR